jgi:hypothetical protein
MANSFFGNPVSAGQPFVTGLTGGSSNKVVRISGANAVVDASNTDTNIQLQFLFFKDSNGIYLRPGAIIETLTGLTAEQIYYLTTAGALSPTAPTPSNTVAFIAIGKALDTGRLYFNPGPVIGGVL